MTRQPAKRGRAKLTGSPKDKSPLALIIEDTPAHRALLVKTFEESPHHWTIEVYEGTFDFDDVAEWVHERLARSSEHSKICLVLDLVWVRANDTDRVKEEKQNAFIELLVCPEGAHIRLEEVVLQDGLKLLRSLATQSISNFTIVAVSTFGLDSLKNLARHLGADHTIQKYPSLDRMYPESGMSREVAKSTFRSELSSALEELMRHLHRANLFAVPAKGRFRPTIAFDRAAKHSMKLNQTLNTARNLLHHRSLKTGEPLPLDADALKEDLDSFVDWLFNEPWYHRKHCMQSVIDKLALTTLAPSIQGKCAATLINKLGRVASMKPNILLTGESGTGKSLVARVIHGLRPLDGSFQELNVHSQVRYLSASVIKGTHTGGFTDAIEQPSVFELAGNGTVFVDEIGHADIDFQKYLNEILQERVTVRIGGHARIPVTCQLIFATNQDLKKLVDEGKMMEEFFNRLESCITFHLPPLRERRDEIPIFAKYFLDRANEMPGDHGTLRFAKDVVDEMLRYDWPGNVRQLQLLIEKAAILTHIEGLSEISGSFLRSLLEKSELELGKVNAALPTVNLAELKRLAFLEVKRRFDSPAKEYEALGIPKSTYYSIRESLGLKDGTG